MASPPASPHDDIVDIREETKQYEQDIIKSAQSPSWTPINVAEKVEVLSDDDESVSDDRSERSIIARYNLHARIFPPPVWGSPDIQSRGGSSKSSTASQIPRGSPAHPISQSDVNEQSGNAFAGKNDALEKNWFRLMDKKSATSALRSKVAKTRRKMRKARTEKDAADNSFMSLLRPLRLTIQGSEFKNTGTPDLYQELDHSRLQVLFNKMQETRERCQALELSSEALEEELEISQEELDHLERLLINNLRGGEPRSGNYEDADIERPSMPEPLLGLKEEPIENYHPLYMLFMSTLGQYKLTKEMHYDNISRKEEIDDNLHRHELRKNYQEGYTISSLELDHMDQEFLRNFEKEEKASLERMAQLRDEASSLRELCFQKGVVPRYAELTEVYEYYPWEFSIDMDPPYEPDMVSSDDTTAERFWVLLSNPYHLLEGEPVTATAALKDADAALEKDPENAQNKEARTAALKEFLIENLIRDARPGDIGSFVNRWALHKLRVSPHEVELLYSSFTSETGLYIRDVFRWQYDVLHSWPRDEAALAHPERYYGAISRVEASSEGPISDSSLVYSDEESVLINGRAADGQASNSIPEGHSELDAKGDDAPDLGTDEAVSHVPLRRPSASPRNQEAVRFGSVLVMPLEHKEPPKPELVGSVSSEESESLELDRPRGMPSAQTQKSDFEVDLTSPTKSPHSVELKVEVLTQTEEPLVPSAQPSASIEHLPVPLEETGAPPEESNSLEYEPVLASLAEAPPVPSDEPHSHRPDPACELSS